MRHMSESWAYPECSCLSPLQPEQVEPQKDSLAGGGREGRREEVQPGAADGLAALLGSFKSTFLTLKKVRHVPSKPCLELLSDSDVSILRLGSSPRNWEKGVGDKKEKLSACWGAQSHTGSVPCEPGKHSTPELCPSLLIMFNSENHAMHVIE